MEEKSHKKDKLIEDNFLKGSSSIDKKPLLFGENNNRDRACIFQVYDPKENKYETKAFYKKPKKQSGKE